MSITEDGVTAIGTGIGIVAVLTVALYCKVRLRTKSKGTGGSVESSVPRGFLPRP
jgi:hypothetical protein